MSPLEVTRHYFEKAANVLDLDKRTHTDLTPPDHSTCREKLTHSGLLRMPVEWPGTPLHKVERGSDRTVPGTIQAVPLPE
jgi:hypothetical protein